MDIQQAQLKTFFKTAPAQDVEAYAFELAAFGNAVFNVDTNRHVPLKDMPVDKEDVNA